MEIFCLSEKGLNTISLGKNITKGEVLQAIIPAGIWFGAKVKDENNYTLVSCTVAPGFDFQDFELATKKNLLNDFPEYKELVDTMSLS